MALSNLSHGRKRIRGLVLSVLTGWFACWEIARYWTLTHCRSDARGEVIIVSRIQTLSADRFRLACCRVSNRSHCPARWPRRNPPSQTNPRLVFGPRHTNTEAIRTHHPGLGISILQISGCESLIVGREAATAPALLPSLPFGDNQGGRIRSRWPHVNHA